MNSRPDHQSRHRKGATVEFPIIPGSLPHGRGSEISSWSLILCALCVLCGSKISLAQPLKDVGITQHLNAQLPNLLLTDSSNLPIHLQDLRTTKPILLVIIQYNCPNLCSTILNDLTNTLKVIPQNLGDQYDVWTLSFDPTETPTLAAAKKIGYVKTYNRARPSATHAEANWHFLTADAATIKTLTDTVGYRYHFNPETDQYTHPAALILLTPELKISRYFFGIDYSPTDLRLSLVEASHNKIGTLTDQLLLFCYHYDPATGRYGLAIANTLKLSAALTTLSLFTGIALLLRADRRRTQRLLKTVASSEPRPSGSGLPSSTPQEQNRSLTVAARIVRHSSGGPQ